MSAIGASPGEWKLDTAPVIQRVVEGRASLKKNQGGSLENAEQPSK
jgi:hypothetical protein